MQDVLPAAVFDAIRRGYLSGVARAELRYADSAGDEDSLSGALGMAISSDGESAHNGPDEKYTWKTGYTKLRGRGANAPEKKYGADGMFHIKIQNEEKETLFRKRTA